MTSTNFPIHPSITFTRIQEALDDDLSTGFCLTCGDSRDSCEPDAQNYECPHCGALMVFGAQEILLTYCDILKD